MSIVRDYHFTRERNVKRDIESITSTSLEDAIKKNRSSLLVMLDSVGKKNSDHYHIISGKIREALDKYAAFLGSEETLHQNKLEKTEAELLLKAWEDEDLILKEIVILHDEWEKAPHNYPPDLEKLFHYKFNFACYYLEIAAQAYCNEKLNLAWPAINHSSLLIGELERLSDEIHEVRYKQEESIRNAKNSAARTKIINGVKSEAAKLIITKKPAGGWKSRAEVRRHVAPLLAELLQTNKIAGMTVANIDKRLGEWLAENPVLISWEACKRSK